jgi:hypothetical protein
LTRTTPSYDRELAWNEPPSPSERRYRGWTVVRPSGAPAARWTRLARVADVDLYLAPPGTEVDAAVAWSEPVLAGKRGRRRSGDYPGVDGQVRLPGFFDDGPATDALDAPAPEPPVLPALPPVPAADAEAVPVVRVAIVDVAFGNLGALHGLGTDGAAVDGPFLVGLPEPGWDEPELAPLSSAPGHGTAMAGILLAEVPGVRLGLFRIPSVAGAARPYLAATDLAAAIAAAAGAWRADVVLVAMSDGAWGTPRHLREVLRAAARAGRGGRGTAIFCSVGDPSRNHVRGDDSAALGADDLASQPWTVAIAACDRHGRWYRVHTDYRDGAAYNRFGPAVALAASGEPRRYGERVAADDSSQASALAAAAAACVLGANPALTAAELRAVLALTADVPAAVDGGPGLAAGVFDGRDRLGHSLKTGYGVVNARAACLAAADPVCLAILATREVPDPDPVAAAGAPSHALAMAEAWTATVRPDPGLLASAGPALGRGYAAAAGALARLYLRSLPLQEALGWLARHLRALTDPRDGAPGPAGPAGAWWSAGQDHGALVERVRHAADVARDEIADGAVTGWLAELEMALAASDGGGARLAAFLATAFAPVRRTQELELLERRDDQLGTSDDDGQRGQT